MANRKFGWHSGAVHCKSITIGSPVPAIGAGNQVGNAMLVTTNGSGRTWAAGSYTQIQQGSVKNVTGYITAAEFEVTLAAVANVSEWAVITLNSSDSNAIGSYRSFIWLREYGSMKMNSLLRFGETEYNSIAATDKTTLLSTAGDLATTHTIRCMVGTTPIWITCNNVGP
jgi:hypothetical protein